MNRDQQRLADYLAHILEAICRIERYTGPLDQASFLQNQLVQDAVIRNLEISRPSRLRLAWLGCSAGVNNVVRLRTRRQDQRQPACLAGLRAAHGARRHGGRAVAGISGGPTR